MCLFISTGMLNRRDESNKEHLRSEENYSEADVF
jgi:hypothetical protein